MNGMDVGPSIEQQRHDLAGSSDHRPVQRRTSGPVAAVYQRGIDLQERANTPDRASFRRSVDWMVGVCVGWFDTRAAGARLFKKRRNRFMTALSGQVDQAVAVVGRSISVRAGIEQHLHGFEVPFTDGEVNQRPVGSVPAAQCGTPIEQAVQRGHVTRRGRCDGVPNILIEVRFKFAGVRHSQCS
jgi:hypothetical protein